MSDASTAPQHPSTSISNRAIAISVRDLSKMYRIEKVGQRPPHSNLLYPFLRLLGKARRPATQGKDFWALDGVSFDVARGESVAVIGPNGAGKTTLLKILSRIVTPTRGEARIRGRVTSLLEVGTGFSNALTGRENVFVNASMHGLGRKETEKRFDEIVEFSGIDPRFVDMRVKHYSSGMRVRLAFSVAAHLDADILLLDEVLAVGDMAFQEKCLERVEGMVKQKRTVLFVSHDMGSVVRFCERAICLDQGRIVMEGPSKDVVAAYSERMRRSVTVRKWTEGREGVARAAQGSVPEAAPSLAAEPGSSPSAEEEGEILLGPDQTLQEPPAARMASVCAIDKDEKELRAATVDERVGIEFVYDVVRGGRVVLPVARFYNDEGIHLFTAVITDPEHIRGAKDPGRYRSVVWVPPHFFNPGLVHVSVSLTTPTSGKLVRHVVIERAVSFEVFEAPAGVVSARGPYRTVKGAVRPLLQWETHRIEGHGSDG